MDYSLENDGTERLIITFQKKSDITSFIRWDFYSRILHSLVPSQDKTTWVKGNRLDIEIRGWPKIVRWNRVSDLQMASDSLPDSWLNHNLDQWIQDVEYGTSNAIDKVVKGGVKFSVFQIGNHSSGWVEYAFASASREVAALCMLYDLEKRSRNHIELWLEPDEYPPISNSPHRNWPRKKTQPQRYFGDPSKAVESLEKMGWQRHGAEASSFIERDEFLGSRQEFYRITHVEQQLKHMRIRKEIPTRWRISILERDNFTCLYCGRQHDRAQLNLKTGKHPQLDPDHRIPVNVQSDNSDDSNFHENLITLCSTCNQRKREITKKFQQNDEHDWDNEEWAYPDRIDFLENRILSLVQIYAQKQNCSIDEALSALINNDSKL